MKILTRYIIREHVGPLVFALSALTALLLLQQVAKQFGNLVGKGLSWGVIGEFFLLSIPFIVAMTLPMAVLMAVLYAFSRMAAENEVTALRANGVSALALIRPVLVAGAVLAVLMLFFNDQVLPRANHRLRTLQTDIARKKPTFALREQVINEVIPGKLFLKTAHIDESTDRMRDVVIYNFDDPAHRKTIYADSGRMGLTPDQRDLQMTLHDGYMQQIPRDNLGELTRLYYRTDLVRVRGVGNTFSRDSADNYKSEREMSVCEMNQQFHQGREQLATAREELAHVLVSATHYAATGEPIPQPTPTPVPERITGATLYCKVTTPIFGGVPTAEAATPPRQGVDTTRKRATTRPATTATQKSKKPRSAGTAARATKPATGAAGRLPGEGVLYAAPKTAPRVGSAITSTAAQGKSARTPASGATIAGGGRSTAPATSGSATTIAAESVATPAAAPSAGLGGRAVENSLAAAQSLLGNAAKIEVVGARMTDARLNMARYQTQIQKLFALAAACVVFVLLGAPIALRYPRGGVGMVIGVSIAAFAIYYVGLIAGEDLATKLILSPFLAMWMANILFTVIGILMLIRVQRTGSTARGGDAGDAIESARMAIAKLLRLVGIPAERRRSTA